ncbi:SRPBCC family protein [Streptomyces sp. NBC_01481]|uniref:SRPBCC family protein n=1 Tax=Streptomyces sp. NBC_01481 TaxID=2975869 RepID=UPI0022552570|nr:SRPBCC family protein [Streptomyces sp. NBC_01481]MCX4582420.1 SRPBCC family protein [Streptomyces sp. NBC_01481]
MTSKASEHPTTLTTPSDRELVITRVFDAPRSLVFEAWTKPEHVRQWYGLRSLTTSVCEIDFRPGGAWRWGQTGADGNAVVFSGEYKEIVPPERIVYTEIFEQMPGPAVLTTLTFEEKDGRTTLTSTSVWPSAEVLAGAIAMGMEAGVVETYERLDEHLRTMA